tara:strand:- start:3898 stop:4005 length:108 start_codon:yes stop_codon:yes gene_type:complete
LKIEIIKISSDKDKTLEIRIFLSLLLLKNENKRNY